VPFSELELKYFVLSVGLPRRGTRGPGRPETKEPKDFGDKLYSALFRDELRESLLSSLTLTRERGRGMRVRLNLTDTPELATLPWEFLYDRVHNRFLAQSRRTPLVRYLGLPDPPRPLAVEGPLRLLVMISSPVGYAQLDVEREWAALTGALARQQAAGQVVVERIDATMSTLQRRLRSESFHIFHFVGHGYYRSDWGDAALVMKRDDGQPHQVTGELLGNLLNDHDPMRLAVLNACEGARGGDTDPFAGVAQNLIQQGLPAVVAMQFEITDAAAIIFARELYGAIADGYPLEAALAESRVAISAEDNPTEWGTPVLYSRALDGRLFDMTSRGLIARAASEPEAQPTARPEQAPSQVPGPHEVIASRPVAAMPAAGAQPSAGPESGDPPASPVRPGTSAARQAGREPRSSELARLEHPGVIQAAALNPAGTQLAAICDRIVYLWDITSRQVTELNMQKKSDMPPKRNVKQMLGFTDTSLEEPCAAAFSRDGTRLAAVSGNSACVWEVGRQEAFSRLQADPAGPWAISPDIDWLVVAQGKQPIVWQVRTPATELPEPGRGTAGGLRSRSYVYLPHSAEVKAMAFSPDGIRLATASGRTARLWAMGQPNPVRGSQQPQVSVQGPGRLAATLAFSPDSARFAAASGGTAQVWDMTGRSVAFLRRAEIIREISFGSDGNSLTTISGTIMRVWDLNNLTASWTGDVGGGDVAFTPGGDRFAITDGATIRVSEVAGSEIARLNAAGQAAAAAFNSDGTRLATFTGTIAQVWAV
jgi:WD40 repeat protein